MASAPAQEEQKGLQLSLVQVIAGALATVSAAVVASFAGVKGTMIGAAVMSVTATCASAIYSFAMRHTTRLIRRPGQPQPVPAPTVVIPITRPGYSPPRVHRSQRHLRQRRVGIIAGVILMFALAISVVTVIELLAGESLAGLWGQGGTAPSIVGGGSEPPPHAPSSSTPSSSPSATTSASPSGTATTTSSAPVSPAPTTTTSTTSATTSSPTTSSTSTSRAPTPSAATTTAPSRNFLAPTPSPSAVPSTNPPPATEAPTRVSGAPQVYQSPPPSTPESVIRAFGDARPTEGLVTRTPNAAPAVPHQAFPGPAEPSHA